METRFGNFLDYVAKIVERFALLTLDPSPVVEAALDEM